MCVCIYIYTYIYMCVCVCVCVYVWLPRFSLLFSLKPWNSTREIF